MEVTVGLFLLLFFLAFICEFIDSSVGMGYGTILSPLLIILGFSPVVAIPAILLSQAFGGLTASIFHHQFKNAVFTLNSRDFKIVFVISSFGILATILAAVISINLPAVVLKTYIGTLVLLLGIIVLLNRPFQFSWKKMVGVGIISAFNKGLSGGGFGPVVTAGQILSGQKHKGAVAATTLSEAPICIASFLTYLIGRTIMEFQGSVLEMPVALFFQKMFAPGLFPWELMLALMLGAVFVAPFGALTTRMLKQEKMHLLLGTIITVLGLWTLYKTIF
ncbi:MAG: sulfite exporter TauE/SafE family protein [Calditrichia bacterium]